MPERKNETKTRRGTLWRLAEIKRFGKTPDSALARRSGRTIREVVAERERRRVRLRLPGRGWTAREIKLLGTMCDAELARRLRRGALAVNRLRRTLNIPAFYRPVVRA